MPGETEQSREEPEGLARSHNLTSFKDLPGCHGPHPSPWNRQHVWRELQQLLHLAAPACLQLCAQQGLVVSLYSFWLVTGSEREQ